MYRSDRPDRIWDTFAKGNVYIYFLLQMTSPSDLYNLGKQIVNMTAPGLGSGQVALVSKKKKIIQMCINSESDINNERSFFS